MVLCVEQAPETRRRCFAAPASLPADIQGVFQAGDGTHGAMPADEFDGDEEMVKLELDPFG